jgi:hypothetical protein
LVENIGEPLGGVNVIDFASAQQGINDCRSFGSFMVSAEQKILSAQS